MNGPQPKSGKLVVAMLMGLVGLVVLGMFLIAPYMADAVMERQTAPTELVTRTPSTAHKKWAPLQAPQPVDAAPPAAVAAPAAAPAPATTSPPPSTTTTTTDAPAAGGAVARAAAFDEAAAPAAGAAPAKGNVDKEAVKAAVEAVKPKVAACYDQALKQSPALQGRVSVQLKLAVKDGKGEVLEGEVADSDTASPFFEACVLKELAGADFDAVGDDGEVVVRYPFTFAPE